ncbi:MAG TPA: polysaccharide deacetylase family protein [Burkholderiaceae bacterium]|nr:polysaccharide deacetylase family protein [Burkholderiaceae bacterium]
MQAPTICIALHDVAPATWPQCERLLAAIDEVAPMAVTLLVVPRWHGDRVDANSARGRSWHARLESRRARGDELALHGWRHLDDAPLPSWSWRPTTWRHALGERIKRRFYTAGEGEFAALDTAHAAQRLANGLAWFNAYGWRPNGFVAPAWMLGEHAWQAVSAAPFAWTTSWRHFWLMPERRSVVAPCITASARSYWRRTSSQAWMRAYACATTRHPIVRLGLHPADATYPSLIRAWQRLIGHLLEQRIPKTKSELALHLRAQMHETA